MASRMRCTAIAATLVVACGLAITTLTTPVAAQTAADRETARSLMEQGHDLYDKKDFKEALKRFKAANDIMHVPSTAIWTAKAQVQLGLLVEARDTIAAMRRMPEKPNDPKPFKDARNEAGQLDDQLSTRVPSLTIVLKGAPPGDNATVTIDDVQEPSTVVGLPRSVDPGHHVVAIKSATAQGQAEVDIKEGEQKQLEVNLAAVAPPPPPPAAEQPASAQPEQPPAPVRSHAPTALTWIGIGLAGAGAIAGGVTGFMSMQKTSTIKNDCPGGVCGPNDYANMDSANTLAVVSDIGFGVAGAGAILAVVTLLVGHDVPAESAPAEEAPSPAAEPSDQQQSRIQVVPWLGLGTAGVTGTF
jgi:hypothetical protein